MERDFGPWLERQYPPKVVLDRLSNALRVEKHYGDLDRHFDLNRLESVIRNFDYSTDDQRRGKPNPSKIPLPNGVNIRNNLATYKSATHLYRRFRDETADRVSRGPLVIMPSPSKIDPPRISPRNLQQATVAELLRLHADVLDELRSREIVRSSNGPAGDYAEFLFTRAFCWALENNSKSGHDAIDQKGIRYQIKCRRVTARNPSRQLSALRKLSNNPFDFLAAVLLDDAFLVTRAALIPLHVVVDNSTFTPHVNAHRFILRDSVWKLPGVLDVTDELKRVQATI